MRIDYCYLINKKYIQPGECLKYIFVPRLAASRSKPTSDVI